MELRERRKNKSRDNISKIKDNKFFIDQIKLLLNQIKINENLNSNISITIIQFFSDKNFIPLTQNEIVKNISNSTLFPSLKNQNLKKEIISSLKNSTLFKYVKKIGKYELNLENCNNYLNSLQQKEKEKLKEKEVNSTSNENSNSISNTSIIQPIINFPEIENKVVYFVSEENQQNINFTLDEDNIDNSFTFGEQSQIKMSNKNNIFKDENDLKSTAATEELENKALEKYIPDFDFIFDENKYFKNLVQISSEFLIIYKNTNSNAININKLDNDIKKLNTMIEQLNVKSNPFNEKSSLFNEEKNELFNNKSVIHQQLNLMQILLDNEFLPIDLYNSEKEIFITYQDNFKKLFSQLQEHYNDIKDMEQEINKAILDLKNLLNEISDYFVLQLNEKYSEFYNLIKNISNSKSMSINVNINETVKLFYFYISDIDKLFDKIDLQAKAKITEK